MSWAHIYSPVVISINRQHRRRGPCATTEDVLGLLLEKSGIQHPSRNKKKKKKEEEEEEARSIPELLGLLPLALVQADSFIRSRHRTRREYHRLYLGRRNDLLRILTRAGYNEKTVLTT